ncbi:conserved protein of unknown function [Georgfuchsia toluolica]|uniref:Uncharacterized protein n=1 Tax=Georgfuchsia toluolica TaxID=424218 RepID=A0A916NIH1_9PROT|nr:conserved protein of unknown function [Georgfuchsia toluolica]
MARTGHEFDAQPLQVVIGIAERIDFQFTAVARTRVDYADGERLAKNIQNLPLNARRFRVWRMANHGGWFSPYAVADDLFQDIPHVKLHPLT